MRRISITSIWLFLVLSPVIVTAQKAALNSITPHDLKMHLKFLASDELEGRATGDPGLLITAKYLTVQAEQLGLKPVKEFLQYYKLYERTYDWEKTGVIIHSGNGEPVVNKDKFFVFPTVDKDTMLLSGEVVFAGYGIDAPDYNYSDLEGIDLKDKIVLIMNRAPLNEDGSEALFENYKWNSLQNFQYKMRAIMIQQPKAVMLVMDPKSGYNSVLDIDPAIEMYLSKTYSLKPEDNNTPFRGNRPKLMLIQRNLAESILAGTGKTLEQLQKGIDNNFKPNSFLIENTKIEIQLEMKYNELEIPNVFGVIEGSDPELKNEYIIYLAHYDHLGTDGAGGVFNGADDNGSGTVALLEIAEAFMKEQKRPARSVGFLWVSAEEIGLFGSSYFSNHPLIPEENISAVINIDMLGRTKTEEDFNSEKNDLTVVGRDTLEIIGGLQSEVLMDINVKTLKEMGITGNYTYNQRNHPLRFFYRSDHINFAQKDIPILFYSTGTHNDYHELNDVEEKIDYENFTKMTRFCFMVGFNAANYKGEITVDNPMSGWD